MPSASLQSAIVMMSLCVGAARAAAQTTTRTDEVDAEKAAKAASVQPEERERGDIVITRFEHLFMPEPPAVRFDFGSFRPGAGFAVGANYVAPAGERGLWSAGAALSVNHFKEVEFAADVPPLTTDRVRVRGVARWEDAPDLRFFGIGVDAPKTDEVSYGLRSAESGADVQIRAGRWFSYGAGAGYLDVRSDDGSDEVPSAGVRASPAWWHSTADIAFDSRHSPGYTTSGGLYRVVFHDYAGRAGAPGFTGTEIDLRQFVPVLHNNWIIALQARADLDRPAAGQVIPFFMLPAIGGRDTLSGFENYRFTDNNSLLLRSELRWTPSPLVDMAAFLDQGTVAPTAGALGFGGLKRSWGFGARFHGPSFTALRVEIVHSVEGWRYNIAQGVSF